MAKYTRYSMLDSDVLPVLDLLLDKLGLEVCITTTEVIGGTEKDYELKKKTNASGKKESDPS